MSASPDSLELRPVRGPSALGGGSRRFCELLWLMAVTEFRRAYFGTVLGYFWSLLRPLMLFAVLLFVFTQIFRLGSDVPNYPVLLLFNIVLFGFFQESTTTAVTSVVAQEGIVRKTQFPRLVIPLSIVLTGLMNLGLNMIAVFIFILAYGVDPMWTWLLMPLILLPLTMLTTAVSMLLSALYVRFRDVLIIWTVSATVLFYATPLLYPIEVGPGRSAGADDGQPARGDLRAGPGVDHRPERPDRGGGCRQRVAADPRDHDLRGRLRGRLARVHPPGAEDRRSALSAARGQLDRADPAHRIRVVRDRAAPLVVAPRRRRSRSPDRSPSR